MSAPTKNDWNSFHVESFENKVNVLFYYLCQRGYNMQEIAEQILRDYNPHAAQRVSLITRCYGFEGRNGGAFSSIGATREDVAAFVRAYPNGCEYDGNGRIMKAFLLKRVQARNVSKKTVAPSPNAKQARPWDNWPTATETDTTHGYNEEYEGDAEGSKVGNIIEIVLMIIAFCILKFVLDWNWIVSIIVAIIGVSLAEVFIVRAINKRR